MPRFVILEHDDPRGRHYDFMLEMDGVLKTWSLADPPAIGVEQAAELLPDHRLAYLDYEGLVSGNRGMVKRWDHGDYRMIEQCKESLTIELSGEKTHGQARIVEESKMTRLWKIYIATTE